MESVFLRLTFYKFLISTILGRIICVLSSVYDPHYRGAILTLATNN